MRPYERMVYLTAISILRNQADAEEVAQTRFEGVLETLNLSRRMQIQYLACADNV